MKDIKFEIMFWVNNRDFTTSIAKHYTTIDRLTGGQDTFDYDSADIVAKRQFTGLQDKNGVDIYEGDVLSCYPDHFNFSYQRVVEWSSDRCELGITNNGRSGVILCKPASDSYVVIGNIHENPELLESNNAK